MTDQIIAAARFIAKDCFAALRSSIDGLPGEALDWRPAGEDTNSIAVLATHVMSSTRSWVCVAVDQPLPERDRDSEFRARASDTTALLEWYDSMTGEINSLLKNADVPDWSVVRKTHSRPGGKTEEVPAAYALMHAIEHLREHVAHCGLTRQLWDAR